MKGKLKMEKTNNVTKRELYTAIREIFENTETSIGDITPDMVIEFCDKEIAALDRRAEKARENTAKRKAEGDDMTEAVYAALTDEFATIAAIALATDFEDVTVGKVQYRLKTLVDSNRAEKQEITVEENGKSRKAMGFRRIG